MRVMLRFGLTSMNAEARELRDGAKRGSFRIRIDAHLAPPDGLRGGVHRASANLALRDCFYFDEDAELEVAEALNSLESVGFTVEATIPRISASSTSPAAVTEPASAPVKDKATASPSIGNKTAAATSTCATSCSGPAAAARVPTCKEFVLARREEARRRLLERGITPTDGQIDCEVADMFETETGIRRQPDSFGRAWRQIRR